MAVAKLNLSVENEHDLILISKALSSEIRIRILKTLENHSMSVSEIAKILNEPISSTALNVKILENANLISSEIIYTKLGKTRVCRRTYDNIDISTLGAEVNANSEPREVVRKIRIASYSDYHDITAPCGMVSATNFIARFDEPDIFFSPDRIRAQLIWFTSGSLEWRISKQYVAMPLKELSVSFEACSEAPQHRNDYKSDITVWINDVEIGTWVSPADFGGRRGQLNPSFWPNKNTQYGIWNTWRIDENGSFLNGKPLSDVTINMLEIKEKPYISLKIGVKADAKNLGGINLFGEKFGDYPQDIIVKLSS